MKKLLQELWRDEQGIDALEYGLIAAIISVVMLASLFYYNNHINNTFQAVSNAF